MNDGPPGSSRTRDGELPPVTSGARPGEGSHGPAVPAPAWASAGAPAPRDAASTSADTSSFVLEGGPAGAEGAASAPGPQAAPGLGPEGRPPSAWPYLGRVLALARPYRQVVAAIFALTLLSVVAGVPMYYIPKIVELHYADPGGLLFWIVLIAAAIVAQQAFLLARTILNTRLTEQITADLRGRLFGHLEELSMASVFEQRVGEFAQQVGNDVSQVQGVLTGTLMSAVTSVVQVVIYVLWMLAVLPTLTVGLLVVMPLFMVPLIWINRVLTRQAAQSRNISAQTFNDLVEGVSGLKEILVANRFAFVLQRFRKLLGEGVRINLSLQKWDALAGLLPYSFYMLAFVAIYYLGSSYVREGYQTPITGTVFRVGDLIAYALLFNRLFDPLQTLIGIPSHLAQAAPSVHTVFSLLDRREIVRPAEPKPCTGLNREICFDHVVFGYRPGMPVLHDLSFSIPRGKFTAIVGESGAGKSTVFSLVLRFIDPQAGRILFDGEDLRDFDPADVRRLMGFVPQNPFIFNETIRSNIMYGVEEGQVSDEQLWRAVEAAQLTDFVRWRQADGGLDAPVGFMGFTLSGGLKQRLALARVILRDPQIVVFDEFTANVDTHTERLILGALTRYFGDRTRVMITHKLYTVRDADQIVVLDQGRAREIGTREELLSGPTLFREMWELQRLE